MAHKRVPVSLRIDDDLGEDFLEYFNDLKDTKNLSPFLVKLLHAYYEARNENEDVSLTEAVSNLSMFSPETAIHAHIERMQKQHIQTMQETSMLTKHIEQTLKGLKVEPTSIGDIPLPAGFIGTQEVTPPPQPVQVPVEQPIDTVVENRISTVESKISDVDNKLDSVLGLMQQLLSQPQQVAPVQTPPVQPQPMQTQPVQTYVQPQVEPQYVAPPVQQVAPVVQPVMQLQMETVPVTVAPTYVETASTIEPVNAPTEAVLPVFVTADQTTQQSGEMVNVGSVPSGAPIFEGSPSNPAPAFAPTFVAEEVEEEEEREPASFKKAFGSLNRK